MLKFSRWFALAVFLIAACDGVAISYWRSTSIDVLPSLMLAVLIGLPFGIFFVIFGLNRLKLYYKDKAENPVAPLNAELPQNSSLNHLPQQGEGKWMNILKTSVVTAFGESTDQIIRGMQNSSASADPILRFNKVYPYLSLRAKYLPLSNTASTNITDRSYRIDLIIEQLLEPMIVALVSISLRAVNEIALLHPTNTNQVTLHHEWLGVLAKESSHQDQPVSIPFSLHTVLLLPQHISADDQQELLLSLKSFLKTSDINDEHHAITYLLIAVSDYEDCLNTIENLFCQHLKHNHEKDPQLLLMVGADSWIDQQFLNQLLNINKNAVSPSEGGFAILLADQNPIFSGLAPIARLTAPIPFNRDKPVSEHGAIQADGLIESIDYLQQTYGITLNHFMSDDRFILVDHQPNQHKNLSELMLLANHSNIEPEKLIAIGAIFNDTNAMTSGVSLALALSHAAESEQVVGVINNGGDIVRASWFAAPVIKAERTVQPVEESETA
jgi:hypothetical protein